MLAALVSTLGFAGVANAYDYDHHCHKVEPQPYGLYDGHCHLYEVVPPIP